MEIEQLRQEINELLENVVKHSNNYTGKEHLSTLDASFILKKVNKVQESLTILKYLLEAKHQERGEGKTEPPVKTINIEEVEELTDTSDMKEFLVEKEPEEEKGEPIIVAEIEATEEEKEHTKVENIEHPPIAKLSDGLTLNDRYLYANELFNKDMNAFNDLIKAIDNCANLDEAVALYVSMDWELENEHVISFTNLVERRFS